MKIIEVQDCMCCPFSDVVANNVTCDPMGETLQEKGLDLSGKVPKDLDDRMIGYYRDFLDDKPEPFPEWCPLKEKE